jgi:Spy/CpxP family protein refolding chaperone
MKNFKFLIIIVIVLVIINCVLLGSLWFTKYHMDGPPMVGPPERANEYLIRELKLTPAQVKQYDAMRKQHFETTRKLNNQNRLLRDEFFKNIQTPVLNKVAVNSLQKKISSNIITLDTTTLFHFRKLRTILTADQQQKFDKVIQNALHMMGGPPQGGGPGGPPRDGMRPPEGPPGKNGMHPSRGHRPGMHPPPPRPDGSRPDGPPDGMRPPPPGGGPPPDRDFMPPPGGPPRPGMPPPPGGGPGMPPPGGPPTGY